MLTLAVPVEGKTDTLAIRSVSGSVLAGRMLLRGSKGTSPTELKRTLNSSGGTGAEGQEIGMFLQAQGVPRRCNNGLAQQNGIKGDGMMIEVYIDGSSKENPGPGGAGIMIQDAATKEIIGTLGIPLGHVTNNQAEFLALKHALLELQKRNLSEHSNKIFTDSQLVVGIFSQNWKARANLELVTEIRDLLKEFPKLTFAYVRGHNGTRVTSSPILWRRK